jgi:hypothetical protein
MQACFDHVHPPPIKRLKTHFDVFVVGAASDALEADAASDAIEADALVADAVPAVPVADITSSDSERLEQK